jgi:hypothetical protein
MDIKGGGEMKSRRSRAAAWLIAAGVALILAAGGLFGYNLWTDRHAGEMSDDILSQFPSEINEAIQEKNFRAAGPRHGHTCANGGAGAHGGTGHRDAGGHA